eukprot:CAMPEP_0119011568 /NCGR_PEP_ID=MMETSP1176-20130426/5761_1 /TAXON_ID=265551 /ORGANISM="Synedropsis recta cf, Strain CCMP1620" /LENGTH=162 /DNA_ID=CAMNT_0006964417 /DNA_START=97 /DNA_END=585 /DNA_ORIENTATION=+
MEGVYQATLRQSSEEGDAKRAESPITTAMPSVKSKKDEPITIKRFDIFFPEIKKRFNVKPCYTNIASLRSPGEWEDGAHGDKNGMTPFEYLCEVTFSSDSSGHVSVVELDWDSVETISHIARSCLEEDDNLSDNGSIDSIQVAKNRRARSSKCARNAKLSPD